MQVWSSLSWRKPQHFYDLIGRLGVKDIWNKKKQMRVKMDYDFSMRMDRSHSFTTPSLGCCVQSLMSVLCPGKHIVLTRYFPNRYIWNSFHFVLNMCCFLTVALLHSLKLKQAKKIQSPSVTGKCNIWGIIWLSCSTPNSLVPFFIGSS